MMLSAHAEHMYVLADKDEMATSPRDGSVDYDLNDPSQGNASSGQLYGRPDRNMAPSWAPGGWQGRSRGAGESSMVLQHGARA